VGGSSYGEPRKGPKVKGKAWLVLRVTGGLRRNTGNGGHFVQFAFHKSPAKGRPKERADKMSNMVSFGQRGVVEVIGVLGRGHGKTSGGRDLAKERGKNLNESHEVGNKPREKFRPQLKKGIGGN